MERSTVIRSPHLTLNVNQERLIHRLSQKLERFFPKVVDCEVSIEPPPQSHRKGGRFTVRVDVGVPGNDVHVRNADHDDLNMAIHAAFETAKRLLEDRSQLRRNEVKRHEPGPREIQV